MITGELKSKIDKIWNTLWSGGISNPLSAIEQLTYLLFIKHLDELPPSKNVKPPAPAGPLKTRSLRRSRTPCAGRASKTPPRSRCSQLFLTN